ncbi:MAG: hypothetical protein RI932_232 [Pseudomonadota bacterium]|jgi:hypothetical protein
MCPGEKLPLYARAVRGQHIVENQALPRREHTSILSRLDDVSPMHTKLLSVELKIIKSSY